MVASAGHDESALADRTDGELNTFLADAFSRVLEEFLFMDNGFKAKRNFRISDMPSVFTYDLVKSHLTMKSTANRPLDKIYLREFLPNNKLQDVLLGKGIDTN